jgi:tryptophan-rich sensory protein
MEYRPRWHYSPLAFGMVFGVVLLVIGMIAYIRIEAKFKV